jgi:hypothetical protein
LTTFTTVEILSESWVWDLGDMAMRYVVTDDFVAAHGWTPDKTAKALLEPLARVGVLVERVRGFGLGGFQSAGLPPDAFRVKKAEVIRIVGQVLDGRPPAGPIE